LNIFFWHQRLLLTSSHVSGGGGGGGVARGDGSATHWPQVCAQWV
jgi:hypothetical protein